MAGWQTFFTRAIGMCGIVRFMGRVVGLVVKALEVHVRDADVQEQGCAALSHLGVTLGSRNCLLCQELSTRNCRLPGNQRRNRLLCQEIRGGGGRFAGGYVRAGR